MPDRENVINHFQDAIEASGNGNKWRFVRVDIIEDALELLKEQEPVPPRKVRRYIDYSDTGINCPVTYDCGICGNELPENAKYCPECGKAVKWDDDINMP